VVAFGVVLGVGPLGVVEADAGVEASKAKEKSSFFATLAAASSPAVDLFGVRLLDRDSAGSSLAWGDAPKMLRFGFWAER
jgi:hypothetical protein